MEKYYIVTDNQQKGPYSIEELQELNISLATLVWNEGMENWVEAKNVPELRNIIKISPPPIPKISDVTYKVEAEIKPSKGKLIRPETEIVVAKEIKIASRLVLFSLIAILLSYPICFYFEGGFKWLRIQNNLPDCSIEQNKLKDKLTSEWEHDFDFRMYVYKDIKTSENIRNFYKTNLNPNKSGLTIWSVDSVVKEEPAYIDYYVSSKYKDCMETAEIVEMTINDCYYEALKKSLFAAPITAILLIIGRYVFKGFKWVDKTSKKAS